MRVSMHVQQATSGRSVKRSSARSFNNHCVNSFDLRLITNNAETKGPEEYLISKMINMAPG